MNKKKIILCLIVILMAAVVFALAEQSDQETRQREYQVKAAFLYNFIKFVDWPENKKSDSNDVITIGIIGDDPFETAFESLKEKKIKGKTIIIKKLGNFDKIAEAASNKDNSSAQTIEDIKKCHLLFVCSSEKKYNTNILNIVENYNVLTVGESPDFLQTGGIINFLIEEKKVRFEINIDASDKAKLKISSQLLRLAKRTIRQKDNQEKPDK